MASTDESGSGSRRCRSSSSRPPPRPRACRRSRPRSPTARRCNSTARSTRACSTTTTASRRETYGLIDNANSNTRVGLRYSQDFGAWHFENVNEIGYAPFSTDNTSILHQSPDSGDWEFSNANIRKLDFTLQNDRYGKIWLGQGSMATDGIYEMDLSGTTVIDYSSVADSASGQIIRLSGAGLSFDDSLSGITIGDAFTNYDGPRRVRIRYDTPAFHGFTLAASY